MIPLETRFWAKVRKLPGPNACWLWTSVVDHGGYGHIGEGVRGGRWLIAHRLSWELANGRRVPRGKYVLHSCDTPACVRPEHLRIGTQRENMADKVARGRHR